MTALLAAIGGLVAGFAFGMCLESRCMTCGSSCNRWWR